MGSGSGVVGGHGVRFGFWERLVWPGTHLASMYVMVQRREQRGP